MPSIVQFAHKEKNDIKVTYHKRECMPERIKMMQWWADYLQNSEHGIDRPSGLLIVDLQDEAAQEIGQGVEILQPTRPINKISCQ